MSDKAAEAIRKARKLKGWSQADLAEETDKDQKTIYRIEKGEPTSIDTLRSIANKLGLDVAALIDEDAEHSVRKRSLEKVRRVRDGQDCMRLLVRENNIRWTRVSVERDPKDDAVHAAIVKICEVVDLIRQYKAPWSQLPVRDEYEGAHKLSEALPALETRGWLVELEQQETEVWGEPDHDTELYWSVWIRPDPKRPKRVERHRAKRVARSA